MIGDDKKRKLAGELRAQNEAAQARIDSVAPANNAKEIVNKRMRDLKDKIESMNIEGVKVTLVPQTEVKNQQQQAVPVQNTSRER